MNLTMQLQSLTAAVEAPKPRSRNHSRSARDEALRHGRLLTFAIEVGVFVLVFKLHGGTMAGSFAATVAALLAGFIIPWTLRSKH